VPKKILEWLTVAIPFLEPYPFWVKASVAGWLIFSAVVVAMLLFFRPTPPPGSVRADNPSPSTGQTGASAQPPQTEATQKPLTEKKASPTPRQEATIKDSPNATVYQAGRDLVVVPPGTTGSGTASATIQSVGLEARLTCTTRQGVELPPEKVDLLAWFSGDATLRGPAGEAVLKLVSPVYFQRLTDGRLVIVNRFVLPEDSHLKFRPAQVLATYNDLVLPITTVVNNYSDAIDRVQLLEVSLRINGGDPDYQSYRYDIGFERGKGVTFTIPLRKSGG
jgi:hypothetical protein